MNNNGKPFIIFATLVIVALFLVVGATRLLEPPQPRGVRFMGSPREDIELYYTGKTLLSTINVTLLIILLAVYVNIYRKMQSEFTVGLIIFTVVLLFNAIVSNPLLQQAFGFMAFGLGPFEMLPDLFTLAAVAVLLYITVKY